MRVTLETEAGVGVGGECVVSTGEVRRVGRRHPADLAFPDDSYMSGVHFSIECSGVDCRVRDLGSSNGTFVNGRRVEEAILYSGDLIVAGQARFRVHVETESSASTTASLTTANTASPPLPPPPEEAGLDELQKQVLEILRKQPEPLFAILDAARNKRVLDLLSKSEEQYQSLYEGQQGEDLANFAPYLVRFSKESKFLITLIREGWGKSWGVYLTCDKPFEEVRKHFRHFLLVQTEDGKELYFRFYDPRVLCAFIPSSTPREVAEFFGPISSYLAEGDDGQKHCVFRSRAMDRSQV
jgi:hypothetical protein